MMDLPPLSQDQLSSILSSAATPSELYEKLSPYEGEALLASDNQENPELLSLFYAFFFFSHLLTEQIPEARLLTKRIPENLAQGSTSLQDCTLLLRAVWQRNHGQVYKILEEKPWPELLKPLVQRYEAYFKNKTLEELSFAYEAIRPETAASYLGLDATAAQQNDPAIIQKFTDYGWKWDGETKLLHPKSIDTPQGPGDSSIQGLREVMALLGNSGR